MELLHRQAFYEARLRRMKHFAAMPKNMKHRLRGIKRSPTASFPPLKIKAARLSGWNFLMVELVGVEPMTYTMRTYRSSQLSYSPIHFY